MRRCSLGSFASAFRFLGASSNVFKSRCPVSCNSTRWLCRLVPEDVKSVMSALGRKRTLHARRGTLFAHHPVADREHDRQEDEEARQRDNAALVGLIEHDDLLVFL